MLDFVIVFVVETEVFEVDKSDLLLDYFKAIDWLEMEAIA